MGRLIGLWAPTGEPLTLAHDAGGRRTEKAFPNGVTTRYTWNADSTVAQVYGLSPGMATGVHREGTHPIGDSTATPHQRATFDREDSSTVLLAS